MCNDPDSEDRWHVHDPGRCYATTAIAIKAKDYAESPQPHALLYHVDRRR